MPREEVYSDLERQINSSVFDDNKLRAAYELSPDYTRTWLREHFRWISWSLCQGCWKPSFSVNMQASYSGMQYVCKECFGKYYVPCRECQHSILGDDPHHIHAQTLQRRYMDINQRAAHDANIMRAAIDFRRLPRERKRYGALRYFGIELEVEQSIERPIPPDIIAQTVLFFPERYVMVKHDGSLSALPGSTRRGSNGFELVTLPSTLEYHRKEGKWGEYLAEYGRFLQLSPQTTGLHVHVNTDSTTHLTIAKVICFVNSKKNRKFMHDVAARKFEQRNPNGRFYAAVRDEDAAVVNPGDWAVERAKELITARNHETGCPHRLSFKKHFAYYTTPENARVRYDDIARAPIITTLEPPNLYAAIPCNCRPGNYYQGGTREGHPEQRYEAINIATNKKTFEFRLFRGTTDVLHFWSSIEFCDAILEWAKDVPLRQMIHTEFVEWMEQHRKTYPNLAGWLVNGGWMVMKERKK